MAKFELPSTPSFGPPESNHVAGSRFTCLLHCKLTVYTMHAHAKCINFPKPKIWTKGNNVQQHPASALFLVVVFSGSHAIPEETTVGGERA